MLYKWHTCQLLDVCRSYTGSHGESSGRSYTILLNSGGSCIQILERSRSIVIVLCLLLVFHSVVRVAGRSTAALLILGLWRLIRDCPVGTHHSPCRLVRTMTRTGGWLGGTTGMGRAGIRSPMRQAPSSFTSSIMMATSAATCHDQWWTKESRGRNKTLASHDRCRQRWAEWTTCRSNALYEN